jgi:hypothetical protein
VLNASHGVTAGDELRIVSAYKMTNNHAHAHLDHLFRRKALPSKVRRMFRQSVLGLWHSRWSRLRSVNSSAAERNVVTAAEKTSA